MLTRAFGQIGWPRLSRALCKMDRRSCLGPR